MARKVSPLVALCVAVLAVGASSWVRIFDFDVFWHVVTGGYIASHGEVPKVDPFSYASPGPIQYVDVLADLWLWASQRALGWAGVQAGVVLVSAAIAACAAAYVVASRGKLSLSAVLVASLVGAASHFRFGPKTDQLTVVCVAVTLAVVAKVDRTRRSRLLLALPPLALVWTGLHRGGTLLPVLAALALVPWLVDRHRRRIAGWGVLSIVASTVALALGFGGVSYVTASFDLASRASFEANLPEWASPPLRFFWPEDPAYTVLLVLGAIGLLTRPRAFTVLAAVALVALGTRAVRFTPLAAVGLAPLAASAIEWAATRATTFLGAVPRRLAALAVGTLCVGISFTQYLHGTTSSMRGTGLLDWRVPIGAAAWVRANPPPGLMWNTLNFGGYLLFELWPSQRVLIDGRNDTVYPDALFAEVSRASADPRPFDKHVARWPIGFAVVEVPGLQDTRFSWLQRREDWQMAYLDDLSAVFVKKTPESEAYLAEHGYRELRIETALARAANPAGNPAREAFEREAQRLLVTSPRSIRAHYIAALIHRSAQRMEAYAEERDAVAALVAERGLKLSLP